MAAAIIVPPFFIYDRSAAPQRDHRAIFHPRIERTIMVKWSPPPPGWVKLNTDGCSKGNPGFSGGGGVLRDSNGLWVGGFMVNIGWCKSFKAELWAVFHGLSLAWMKGFRKIILEVDCKLMIGWLEATTSPPESQASLVMACQELLRQDWEVNIVHIYREGNQVADWLANEALNGYRGLRIVDTAPVNLSFFLDCDLQGVSWPRTIRG